MKKIIWKVARAASHTSSFRYAGFTVVLTREFDGHTHSYFHNIGEDKAGPFTSLREVKSDAGERIDLARS